jgi:hypothetical protein
MGWISEDECLRRVHHYRNLQPMWIQANLQKGALAA